MLDVCLLGTGGMMPLPYRWLTSFMTRYEGSNLLIDCGEGTQVAIKEKGWGFKQIDYLLITHYHADHISGLPGVLLVMGNAERTQPLTIIGPRGITAVCNALRVIAPDLPFEINYIELSESEHIINAYPYTIKAFRVDHRIICYGYEIDIPRAGMFLADKAKEFGLPVNLWGKLQNGETVEFEGEPYFPEMVMGPPRKGLKVVYTTDTRPVSAIEQAASGADLFVCEGMYGEAGTIDKAKEHMHMNFEEAATIASKAQPKRMWLTHFSPSMAWPADYENVAKEIFENSVVGKDGMSDYIKFEDDKLGDI